MLADVLQGYAAAVYEAASANDRIQALRDELAVFSAALVGSDALRQALLDPNISPVVRRSVVADLLVGRATPEVASLLGFAIRVVAPPELPIAAADLAAFAGWAAGADEPTSGTQASKERLQGYAERVLEELGSTNEVDEMEDSLFRLARIIEHSPDLRHVLTDPTASLDARIAVLGDLLTGKVSAPTLRVAQYALRAGRLRNLVGTFDWLVGLCAEERGRRVAQVHSAVDLDATERDRLAESLQRLTGRVVEVRVLIDPAVVGGMLVSIGDLVIDGTVRLRIERLRDALAESA